MAISSSYCTHRDLKDVFPQIDEYDTKTPVYGWTASTTAQNKWDSLMDAWYSHNTGLITEMFWNGSQMGEISYKTTETTKLNGAIDADAVGFAVDSSSAMGVGDIVKINDEYFLVGGVSSGTSFQGSRGLFGTTAVPHADDSSVKIIFDQSAEVSDLASDNTTPQFFYDPDIDLAVMITANLDPNDYTVEAGENFSTLITRIIKNASRYFDSRVDARLPRDQWKDKEGNYDYLVVRSTALIAAYFLVNGREPGNPISEQLFEEVNFNLERINTGQVKLSYQVSSDASKGILREVVSPQAANPLHIVDTRGDYYGTYDLLKIVINTAGAIGTAKFDVFGADADNLKATKIISADIINGRYQTVAGGLQIRFAGKDDSSVATLGGTPDEWELEVFGKYESLDESPNSGANTRMTRHRRR